MRNYLLQRVSAFRKLARAIERLAPTAGDVLAFPTATTVAGRSIPGKAYNVNGQFQVDQRLGATRTGLGGASVYLTDMWKFNWDGAIGGRYTFSIEANGGVNGESQWAKFLCTTADAAGTAGDFHYFYTPMEAQSLQGLIGSNGKLGDTCQTQELIVHADGASGITFPCTVGCFLQSQDGTARQWVADVTVPSADTFVRLSIPRTADSVATIDNNNGAGLWMGFCIATGTDRQVTGGAWENSGGDIGTAASINVGDATNNYIGIANVKLEKGLVDTGIEHEDITETGRKCWRYFERLDYSGASAESIGAGTAASTSSVICVIPFRVKKRALPTLTSSAAATFEVVYTGGAVADIGAINSLAAGIEALTFVGTGVVGSPLTDGYSVNLRRDGTDTTFIDISSEL